MPDCPTCGRKLEKIHRRTIDRFVSVFSPINRFRCQDDKCNWEGNLRSRSKSSGTTKKMLWWTLAVLAAMIIGMIIVR